MPDIVQAIRANKAALEHNEAAEMLRMTRQWRTVEAAPIFSSHKTKKAEARIDELCEREYQIREKTHDLYDVIDSAQAEIDRLESGR